ncbi:glycosyltransferase family 2 protein [Paenibacillus lemnae]|uniref:Glycosyltransferase family 2 protein n=1 Tax=Paenibacillus lemnae TaxID=1330551 RepID=A0A848M6M2_PAELE|nr:glycosyltransferase family 2 protein [Paenibacillus lemnae]NMO96637.1 glycosyltransferase family 2 protein [Paenibacillus lemnae]
MKRITVFTPCYNRAYILGTLYESLKKQIHPSFLWLIVDDGSTDDTEELVQGWIAENLIEIQYYKQENGGKQRAHNKGVQLCDTELFICVDSDDYLTEDAVDTLIRVWDRIGSKREISGIAALRGTDRHTPIGTAMPRHIQASRLSDLYHVHGFRGDTALLFRTEILKEFPFYVFEGEKFIGESYVYLQIDQHYSLYILDEIIYICRYLEDGYTRNVRRLIQNNPKGYMLLNRQGAEHSRTLKNRYLYSIRYIIGCLLSGEKGAIRKAPSRILTALALPPALVLSYLTYKMGRK